MKLIRRHLAAALALALLPASVCLAQAYWFEDYLRAVELIDDGDFAAALPLLESVLESHPVSQRRLRIPGNEFINYAPYLQRARISLQAGDLQRARMDITISDAFGETIGDPFLQRTAREIRDAVAQTPLSASHPALSHRSTSTSARR